LFRFRTDIAFAAALWASAVLASMIIAGIVAVTTIGAMPALKAVSLASFVSDPSWHPTEGTFNLWPMLVGTILISTGAVILAAPTGIVSAIFCNFYAPVWLATGYRLLLGALAGIPSVVYGLWGLVVLVPLVARIEPPGASLLTGILVLALMILPTMAVLSDDALRRVPQAFHQGGSALAMPRHRLILKILLPAARSGLATGLVLSMGRAMGETMAVLMVTGNVVQFPRSPFTPVRSLAANIALEMAYAMNVHRAALFVSGLFLVLLVAAVLISAEWIGSREGLQDD
jgi:phosphate transport system permease protein